MRLVRGVTVLALLATCWAIPAAAASSSALGIKGDVLMLADEVDYDVDSHVVTARGHVEIDSDGRMLLADEVTYDQPNDTMTASGHVSLTDEKGNVAFADHIVLKDKMRDGALFPPKYVENKLKFYPNIKEAVAFGDQRDGVTVMLNIDMTAVGR